METNCSLYVRLIPVERYDEGHDQTMLHRLAFNNDIIMDIYLLCGVVRCSHQQL